MFADLSLRVELANVSALREHLTTALNLGYTTVAIDKCVSASDKSFAKELTLGQAVQARP